MTRNDSRPSLWERFVNWETGDESVLDGEIEQSMDQAAPQEAGGEVYASAEKRADDHRTALVEEERSYYSRVHEWSRHKASSSSTGCTASRRCWFCASSSSS